MPVPKKRKRGAKESARHRAKLNERARKRIQAPILEACAPTWQDEVVMWASNNGDVEIKKIVGQLAATDRAVVEQKSLPHESLEFLREAGVVAVSEGFVILSKRERLRKFKIIK